ncbi:MAG TPA: hypothetical protein VKE22_17050 [Haliangiales bacterium]|nr:hypothetical protein [Haliangiales bacterium]
MTSFLARVFPCLRRRRPAAIGALRAGRAATVRGRVVPRDLLDSPLRGERCVYYRCVHEQWRDPTLRFPGGGGTWNVTQEDEAIAEFYLEDGTGRALVFPEGAEVAAGALRTEEVGIGLRASEACILPDDVVEVAGIVDDVVDVLDDLRGYREGATRVLLRAPAGGRLRIRVVRAAPIRPRAAR